MLGLFGGLVLLFVLVAVAVVESLAIQFWFLSIPLFCLWFYWMLKREQKRQRDWNLNATPAQKAYRAAEHQRLMENSTRSKRLAAEERARRGY